MNRIKYAVPIINAALLMTIAFTAIAAEQQAEAPEAAPLEAPEAAPLEAPAVSEYKVGIDDILDISVLQPEQMLISVTVAPDGCITFPYIGNVNVKGLTLGQVQEDIQKRLADGYMKYPVVSVSLKESRSKKFFVYGEVARPGTYFLEENMTALKAISVAGGFSKYGSSSRVKILRPKKDATGYENIKVNIKAIMNGSSVEDVKLQPGDIVNVEEGMF